MRPAKHAVSNAGRLYLSAALPIYALVPVNPIVRRNIVVILHAARRPEAGTPIVIHVREHAHGFMVSDAYSYSSMTRMVRDWSIPMSSTTLCSL